MTDPDFTLEYDGTKMPVFLKDGLRSIDESWFEPSSFGIQFSRGRKKYGDDPFLTMAEWRDWTGGRGGINYLEDETRYHDGLAWSLSPGIVMPPPRPKFVSGISYTLTHMPQDAPTSTTKWLPLRNTDLVSTNYITKYGFEFKATATKSFESITLPMRRVGTPGTLTLTMHDSTVPTDWGGTPNTTLKTVTITTSDVTDLTTEMVTFTFNSAQTLTVDNYYFVFLTWTSTDTRDNHWEWLCLSAVNSDTSRGDAYYSGTTYNAGANLSRFYRINETNTLTPRFYFQHFGGKFYAVSVPASGNSQLFEWNETTDVFTEVTGHGLTIVSGRPLVSGGMMYFPQGESVNIRRWTGAAWADDGTNKASKLFNWYDGLADVPQVVRVNNTSTVKTISFAPAQTTATDLVFGTAIQVGDGSYPITNIAVHEGILHIIKEDSLWSYENGVLKYIDSNLKNTPSSRNGNVFISWNNLLYFSWLNTIMQSYGAVAGDIGQMWRGEGPTGNRAAAYPSCAIGIASWLFVGYDAGTSGQSYVHVYNGLTWHELYRAPKGKRIRDIFWQHVDGARPRLFIDLGTDIVYIEMAKDVAGLRYDSTVDYMWEYDIVTTTFDDGTSRLPKYFKDITFTTQNLNSLTTFLEVDYQFNEKVGLVGASNWMRLGTVTYSPEQTLPIGLGDARAIRFRVRGYTNSPLVPPMIEGITLTGYTKNPSRRLWNVVVTAEGSGTEQSSVLLAFLNHAAETSARVRITRAQIPELRDRTVVIRHPRVSRSFLDVLRGRWAGYLTFSMLDVT